MLRLTHKLPFVNLENLHTHDIAGEGGDFLELGEYVYGQDARLLSPAACLKHQKPMTKIFQKQALSHLHIFLLPSKSLLLGTPPKLESITRICDILLQSAQVYGLKPLLHYLDSHKPQTFITHKHIRELLDSLKALRFSHRDQLHKATGLQALRHLIAHKHKKGLGVIIGDFYKLDSLPIVASLKHYLVLYALCVRSNLEWEPKFLDTVRGIEVCDVETGESCEYTLTLAQYKENLAHYDARLRAYFTRMGARLSYLDPHDTLLPQLQRAFH